MRSVDFCNLLVLVAELLLMVGLMVGVVIMLSMVVVITLGARIVSFLA